MSNEDVIELGSSDDETEPPPKKMKPRPNAMVHIPNKLRGVTIKPVKANTDSIPKVLAGKPITVTKAFVGSPMIVPKSSTVKPNSTTKTLVGKANPPAKALAGKPITITKLPNVIANPYAIISKVNGTPTPNQSFSPASNSMRTLNKSTLNSLQIKKIVPQCKSNNSTPKLLVNPIRVQSPRSLNNLPSSITVTRTSALKRTVTASVSNTAKKKRKMLKNNISEVLTVELDDDEAPPPKSNLQWYMRPEEVESTEKMNNKEPEPSKFIEITIEDSPIKPIQNKNTYNKIGTELAITIDDSPVKNIINKNAQSSGSDNDKVSVTNNKEPHSKKKLEYPNQAKVLVNTVEIEIEPMEVSCEINNTKQAEKKDIGENFIEIQESPRKNVEDFQTSTPKKDNVTQPLFKHNEKKEEFEKKTETEKNAETENKLDTENKAETENKNKESEKRGEVKKKDNDISSGEFHPVYQSFIDLCFKLEDSEDMKKIVEKKIKTYYRQVPKTYTESEEFIDMVSSKLLSMKAGPEKMYLYIKDIVDELNMQRKLVKAQILNKATSSAESDKFLYGEDSEYDSKRQRQIRKLEKTLKKLHRAIQKLEEQEVDFDDEEDSVYLLTESEDGSSSNKDDNPVEKKSKLLKRYKERMVRVHAKFCQLTNTKMPSEPRVQIDARPGQPTGPAKRLEKWVNKKVPIGAPLPFPDFHDVIRCVKEANEEDKLGWNDADVMEEARDLFTRCGKKLQRRRQENEWRSAASRISIDMDPAENSEDLRKQLDANQQLAFKKETDVLNKYADRQNKLKLEGEEIGDKEADESPVESEDDEAKNESSLENKEKRKERLKRLLQEKSKKITEEKENQPTEANEPKSTNVVAEKDDTVKFGDVSIIKDTEMREVIVENNDTGNASNELRDCSANNDDMEKSHSISDDSNKLESDIDELHLLQKLHSESEAVTSTLESSDSDSPIAISDTLDSCSDNKKQTSDVISIENSSYSESENNKDDNNLRIDKIESVPIPCKEIVDAHVEIECSNAGIQKKRNNSNNDEYNESIEDILLASSDDDTKQDSNLNDVCVNLKDDALSIGETVIEGAEFQKHDSENLKSYNKDDTNSLDGSSVESLVFVPTGDECGNIKEPDESTKNESIGDVKQSDIAEKDQAEKTVQESILPEKIITENTVLINDSDRKTEENIDSVHLVIESNNTPKDNNTIIEEIAGSSSESNDGVTGSMTANKGITVSSL